MSSEYARNAGARLVIIGALAVTMAPTFMGWGNAASGALAAGGLTGGALVLRRGLGAPLDLFEGYMAMVTPPAAIAGAIPLATLWTGAPVGDRCSDLVDLTVSTMGPFVLGLLAATCWAALVVRRHLDRETTRLRPTKIAVGGWAVAAIATFISLMIAGCAAAVLNAACGGKQPTMALVLPFLTTLSAQFGATYLLIGWRIRKHMTAGQL